MLILHFSPVIVKDFVNFNFQVCEFHVLPFSKLEFRQNKWHTKSKEWVINSYNNFAFAFSAKTVFSRSESQPSSVTFGGDDYEDRGE